MIEIKATARRVFHFPATVPLAIQFFSDFPRVTQFLPHISLIETFENGHHRVLYETIELAAYRVHIFADVKTEIDVANRTLYVRPSEIFPAVKARSTLRSLTAGGSYRSDSIFRETADECEVTFVMELAATLPRPSGLRFVPESVLNRIADNITNHRMNEIIEGFITKSVKAYSLREPVEP
jgi:hypothetical protein